MSQLPAVVEDPVLEDTKDFSEEEARSARVASNNSDMVSQIGEELRGELSGYVIQGYSICRKTGKTFLRVRLGAEHQSDRVLVFHADWMI